MKTITREENYEYRMKNIIDNFVYHHLELQGLTSDELQDKLWNDYAKDFAHAVLEDISSFSGDELFDVNEDNLIGK